MATTIKTPAEATPIEQPVKEQVGLLTLGGSPIISLNTNTILTTGAKAVQLTGLNNFGQVVPELTLNVYSIDGEEQPEALLIIFPYIKDLNFRKIKLTLTAKNISTDIKKFVLFPYSPATPENEDNFINGQKQILVSPDNINSLGVVEFNVQSTNEWIAYAIATDF